MLVLDITSEDSPGRECEVWFAERPFRPKGFEKVTFKQTRVEVTDFPFPPRPFDTLICDLRSSEEELRSRLSQGKRSDLNIARNRGFSITFGNSLADFQRLHRVHSSFAVDKSIGGPPGLKALNRNARYCLAAFINDAAGQPLCWHMYLLDRPVTRVWFGGSDLNQPKADRGYANTLLHWHMMLHFKKEGYEVYDWGGAVLDPDSPLYSITRYKLSFGPEPMRTFGYSCYYPPSLLTRVRRKGVSLLRKARARPPRSKWQL